MFVRMILGNYIQQCHEIIALYYAILIALSSTKYDVRKQFVFVIRFKLNKPYLLTTVF